jgi:hypothetical protein
MFVELCWDHVAPAYPLTPLTSPGNQVVCVCVCASMRVRVCVRLCVLVLSEVRLTMRSG